MTKTTRIRLYLTSFFAIFTLIAALSFVGVTFAHEGHDHGEDSAEVRAETSVSVDSDTERSTSSDDDGDGIQVESEGEVEVSTDASNQGTTTDNGNQSDGASVRAGVTKEIDKASPKLMQTLSIDASSPVLYQGVSVMVSEDACAGEDCDDESGEVKPGEVAIKASGEVIRNWSEENKQEVQNRLEQNSEVTTANDFGIWVAGQALENDSIVDISSDSEQTEVRYNTRMRLFGFIPLNTRATARTESNGEVKVSYPWYSFLAAKGDQSVVVDLTSEVRTRHDALGISVEEEGAPVNRTSDQETE